MTHKLLAILAFALFITSCREPIPEPTTKKEETRKEQVSKYQGLFLLNEGNMGSNKCTLDYNDFAGGWYCHNIYPVQNRDNAVTCLGDSGNDLQIYGGKLYAVVNGSHLVEVMSLESGRHVATVSVPNCRYIVFDGGYAYVSSYAAENETDIASATGSIYKIDTVNFKVAATCRVGYQPEEMAVCGRKLYVANSGGYRYDSGDYDKRVSVVNLNDFTHEKFIEVAPNLHRMEADSHGQVWVSSRGNYYDIPSKISIIDSNTDTVTGEMAISTTDMALCRDSLYIYGSEWSYELQGYKNSYAVVNVKMRQKVADKIITDGSDAEIQSIYGMAVNPETGDIFITDAMDYMTPGTLFCFSRDGKKKWSKTTGDIPSRMAFTPIKCKVQAE